MIDGGEERGLTEGLGECGERSAKSIVGESGNRREVSNHPSPHPFHCGIGSGQRWPSGGDKPWRSNITRKAKKSVAKIPKAIACPIGPCILISDLHTSDPVLVVTRCYPATTLFQMKKGTPPAPLSSLDFFHTSISRRVVAALYAATSVHHRGPESNLYLNKKPID